MGTPEAIGAGAAGGSPAALQALAGSPPWQVAATTFAAYLAIVVPLACAHGVDSLIRVGSSLTRKSAQSPRISSLHSTTRVGYDGQYAYFIALDPLRARYYMDRPSYRYGRILYPAVAWVAAFGQPGALPYALLAINVLAIVAMVYLLARHLRRRDVSAWWAAVYGFFPGLIICALADLTEPLAYFLAGSAVIVLERRPHRPLLAALLFGLAALTRETTLVFPLIAVVALALRGRCGARPATSSIRTAGAVLFVSTAPYLAYRFALEHWLGTGLQAGVISSTPFGGFARWPFDQEHIMVLLAVILPGMAWLALAGWATVRGRRGIALAFVAANVAAFVVWLPPIVYSNFGGAGRALIGLALAAVLSLPLLRGFPRARSPIVVSALLLLTLGWAIAAAGIASVA